MLSSTSSEFHLIFHEFGKLEILVTLVMTVEFPMHTDSAMELKV